MSHHTWFKESWISVDEVDCLSFNLLELFILNVFNFTSVILLAFLLSFTMPLSISYLFLEFSINRTTNKRTHIDFNKSIRCSIRKMIQIFMLCKFRVILISNPLINFDHLSFNLCGILSDIRMLLLKNLKAKWMKEDVFTSWTLIEIVKVLRILIKFINSFFLHWLAFVMNSFLLFEINDFIFLIVLRKLWIQDFT